MCSSLGALPDKVKVGEFFSKTFKCDDKSAKAEAIEGLLRKMGFTPALCGGSCPRGKKCKPVGLYSDINDDVELSLVENAGRWSLRRSSF